jgi:2-methylcitrate dehydratase PrpD
MGTTEQVAKFITGTRYEDIPQPAIDFAKLCILDGIGCAVYASGNLAAKMLTAVVEEMGGEPTCQVLGTRLRTNAVNAAMVNGQYTHLEDFDDMGNGHHAAVLMPTTLALGEEKRVNGRDALTAYIVGLDVTAYTTIAIGSDHYAKGWHQTSTTGTLGATAVAARLLGLDVMQTRHALGIASSQAGGIRAAFGTMTKALHPANAARAGVFSAKLAARGYEGNPDVIEDRYGFFSVFGQEQAQLASLSRSLGVPFAIMGRGKTKASGVQIKMWPSCGITHGTATVLKRLLKKQPIKAEDVEAVEVVTTYNPSIMAANIRFPKTPLQGKFSPWYTIASILLDGKLDLSSFSKDSFERPLVQDLLKRVSITQDREQAGRPARAVGGDKWWDVTIRLRNGKTVVADRYEAHGDHFDWESREGVFAKFRDLSRTVLSAGQMDAVQETVMDLENCADLSRLAPLLTPALEYAKASA